MTFIEKVITEFDKRFPPTMFVHDYIKRKDFKEFLTQKLKEQLESLPKKDPKPISCCDNAYNKALDDVQEVINKLK